MADYTPQPPTTQKNHAPRSASGLSIGRKQGVLEVRGHLYHLWVPEVLLVRQVQPGKLSQRQWWLRGDIDPIPGQEAGEVRRAS